jgi:sterol desaturase/sphingolipid hydroxylase (fatty acid hydroxylase superfamily)
MVLTWAAVRTAATERAIGLATSLVSMGTLSYVGGIALVLAIELVVLGYARSSVYRLLHPTRSTRTDILWFALKVLGLNGMILSLISLGTTTLAARVAERYLGFHVLVRIENDFVRFVVYVVAVDFLEYWVHRARHQLGWWWELHKAHHSAEEFNAITTTRGHPFDGVAMAITTAVPIAVLGGSMVESIPVLTLFAAHAGLTHSMLPWRWGWFGRYVVFPPTGHRIHHSALPEHRDKNFGAILPVWDWIFGTYYRGDVLNEEVGVDDNYQNRNGIRFDLAEAGRRALRAARGRTAP